MSNCKIIMVTSCKGGVGKSTVAANLAFKLAENGLKTLIIDCDFGVRSLDLILGVQDEVVFDISDILLHDVAPDKAIIHVPETENLCFCAAPYRYDNPPECDTFRDTICKIGEELSFDYIIIDTPGDTGTPFRLAADVSDMALVISTFQPASIRAAERTGQLLQEQGVEDRRLIINCFPVNGARYIEQPGILDIIDKTCLPLLGMIPYDTALQEKQAEGKNVFTLKNSNAAVAFNNIADRLLDRNVPLLTGFHHVSRLKLIRKFE